MRNVLRSVLNTAHLRSSHRNTFRHLSTRLCAPVHLQRRFSSNMAENQEPTILDKVKNLALGDKDATPAAKQPKKEKKEKKAGASSLELSPPPEFIQHRIKIFDEYWAKYQAEIANKPREEITITFPDGKTQIATAYEITPLQIANSLSKSLANDTVIAKVDGELWDLDRPLEKSCSLQFLKFDDEEGRAVYWHSSAHVLGEACERHYGCLLSHGPPTHDGFFYDMAMDERSVSAEDYQPLEKIAQSAIQEKQPFQRLDLPKTVLLEMFQYSKYKVHFIKDKIPDGGSTTVYRCGPLIDLCTGPHIPHTGRIKAFSVMKNSAAYWLGDAKNDSLQRIYGVSFPDKKQMTEHKTLLAEAAKRDHRKIGREQNLFFFHELSPGSCFFLPHGMRIYNTLQNFIRQQYHARGFQEVGTPNMYNSKLWVQSGHWQNYQDDMFVLDVDKEKFALKPMNCPGHCLMFKNTARTYREFPIRFADFGVLHRNEASGALTGLTRVRRFQQDDAHIFCREDQIKQEIMGSFDFLSKVYETFGFQFKLVLSTRNPNKFLGSVETWNRAESALAEALDERIGKGKWGLNPEDGAFYGPKIDITISDALKREHQCATIQLDYQLPERFDLQYQSSNSEVQNHDAEGKPLRIGHARPVMIHRAILGSVERMIAILTEHFAGKWPLWISPRQVIVLPVAHAFDDYASEVASRLHNAGFYAEANLSSETLNKRILEAQVAQWNYIVEPIKRVGSIPSLNPCLSKNRAFRPFTLRVLMVVVGQVEQDGKSVNVRIRDDVSTRKQGVPVALEEFVSKLTELRDSRSLSHALGEIASSS